MYTRSKSLKPGLRLVFAILLMAVMLPAQAASVTWTLNKFAFDDGGTASGSFTWDNVGKTATSWNISVSGGNTSSFPALTYTSLNSDSLKNGANEMLYFEQHSSASNKRQFRIGLASLAQLDSPVAVLSLFSVNTGQTGANGFLECNNCSPFRIGQAGAFLSAAPVPEPSTWALFGIGLAGLFYTRRRARAVS